MAQALTTTRGGYSDGPLIRVYTLAWTSAADGSVDLDTDPISGEIQRVVFVPGTGGTQPSNAYDVLLNDSGGIDVLGGQGANLSNAANSHVCPGVAFKDGVTTSVRPITVSGTLNLEVAAAGDSKTGSIIIYVR